MEQLMDNSDSTLTSTIQAWQADGFTKNFVADSKGLKCSSTNRVFRPHLVRVHEQRRFEGESDPADSLIAFAITASDGVTRGIYVAQHGAGTPEADARVLSLLPEAR